MKREIIQLNLNDIKLNENNPRTINKRQMDRLVKSVQEFPEMTELRPIVVDENNTILGGNMRYRAMQKLGYKQTEVVKVSGLTDEQKREFIIKDNVAFGDWDWDALADEWDTGQLDEWGLDIPESEVVDQEVTEVKEDEAPEVKDGEPKAKRGDIYQLGRHRLMCGDSTKAEDIDRLMDGVKADMVFTDPPYGYNYQSNKRTKSKKFDVLENDDKILDFFPNLLGRVKGFVMICTTWKVLDKWLPLFKQYFDLSNMIIWDKGGGGIGDLKHTFFTDYEVILCANNGEEIREKRIGSVWSIGKDNANDYEHPTQKPVELSANAIRHTTDKEQVILDCFGGSGSTLIACEQLNRKCYMMELDPHYIDVIIQRWENFTGKKAEKIN